MAESRNMLRNYQNACELFYKKCISVEESCRTTHENRFANATFQDSDEETEREALLTQETETQRSAFEKELYNEIMAERARETQEIAESVRDINDIFQQVNEMVGEQGIKLDLVDRNISVAQTSTSNGVNQLRRANAYQQDSSNNNCLFFLLLAIVAFICLLLIF
ncbi:syntaxin 7 [Angomonas deanei]|nr:syntaxin 7 [Angomonas deanei]|eukprot:EPY36463.1 syntaxin 7 [Angomonas deanei]